MACLLIKARVYDIVWRGSVCSTWCGGAAVGGGPLTKSSLVRWFDDEGRPSAKKSPPRGSDRTEGGSGERGEGRTAGAWGTTADAGGVGRGAGQRTGGQGQPARAGGQARAWVMEAEQG